MNCNLNPKHIFHHTQYHTFLILYDIHLQTILFRDADFGWQYNLQIFEVDLD